MTNLSQTIEAEQGNAAPVAPVAAPVTTAERFASIDVVRGFALLGILAMNSMARDPEIV
ncbi:MAG: hypothetical protein NT075_21515 [Chloroflexi bacterium]|nr:hypothetical protein [Chloroflexota bacterium]